ncbi:MAG TPA: OmpH family outer membrane protein [Salinimicrobium sp.]|nr:OmpH family outer membrane protein [Salinimicrobium sp.]
MKKSVFTGLAAIFLVALSVQGQQTVRIGYVDMEYILENIPEYQKASAQLEARVQQWKQEIETELQKIETMKENLENEKALLTEELIEARREEIRFQEQKILEYQQKRFGPNGDLMTQKLQLVKPIQDQVFTAVQEIAKNRDYDLILNKSADIAMIYVAERLDVSDQVLRSIKRASNREQVDSREEGQELLQEEDKTLDESKAVSKRELLQESREKQRQELIAEKRRQRDSIRAAKKAAYEAERQRILEKRQKKKDSIAAARKEKVEEIK